MINNQFVNTLPYFLNSLVLCLWHVFRCKQSVWLFRIRPHSSARRVWANLHVAVTRSAIIGSSPELSEREFASLVSVNCADYHWMINLIYWSSKLYFVMAGWLVECCRRGPKGPHGHWSAPYAWLKWEWIKTRSRKMASQFGGRVVWLWIKKIVITVPKMYWDSRRLCRKITIKCTLQNIPFFKFLNVFDFF